MTLTLTETRARDLMQKKVVTLASDTPVEAAIRTLEECNISGAPVVDPLDNLVGVLSRQDVVRAAHVRDDRMGSARGEYYLMDPLEDYDEEFFSKEDYSPEVLGREVVRDWMNPEIISVEPDAGLAEVCRCMVSRNIHRVLVVEDDALKGIVSTFDVVRYLAQHLKKR
jgi:CBS domain-containing protein